MPAYHHVRHRNAAVACMLATAVLILGGCGLRPEVLSARSHREGQDEVVQVTLRSADGASIKRRRLDFSLVIVNCKGGVDDYPAEPEIAGQPVPGFGFPVDGETVQITGRVPGHVFARYPQPCVLLEGGGYLTGTIKSSMAPIIREVGTGLASNVPRADPDCQELAWYEIAPGTGRHERLYVFQCGSEQHWELRSPHGEVLAIRPVPEEARNHRIMSYGACEFGKEESPGHIIGLGPEGSAGTWTTQVVRAWSVDVKARAIVDHPTTGLRCCISCGG